MLEFLTGLIDGVRANAPLTRKRVQVLAPNSQEALNVAFDSEERAVKAFLACAEKRYGQYLDCCLHVVEECTSDNVAIEFPLPPWYVYPR